MRMIAALLFALSTPLLAQEHAPQYLYIYRDSLKHGVDSAFRAIEQDAAQICANFRCPNPYLALESLSGPHEVWWINAFSTAADTSRVVKAYAANRPLMDALGTIAKRKAAMIGTPIQGYAVLRPELRRGPRWSVGGARFVAVTVTRTRQPTDGTAWEMADSTLYFLRPVRAYRDAAALARRDGGRVFAVRPNLSMPAPEWVASDPEFWRSAPAPRSGP